MTEKGASGIILNVDGTKPQAKKKAETKRKRSEAKKLEGRDESISENAL